MFAYLYSLEKRGKSAQKEVEFQVTSHYLLPQIQQINQLNQTTMLEFWKEIQERKKKYNFGKKTTSVRDFDEKIRLYYVPI